MAHLIAKASFSTAAHYFSASVSLQHGMLFTLKGFGKHSAQAPFQGICLEDKEPAEVWVVKDEVVMRVLFRIWNTCSV